MAEIRVTLSANAGICVQIENQRIWVDVLHNEKQPGFSAVSSSLYQKIVNSDAFASNKNSPSLGAYGRDSTIPAH